MKIGLYLGYKLHLHTCFEYASSECSDTQARISLDCSSKISCAVLVFVISLRLPSKHVKSGHYRPTSKTPSERHLAGGPMVARDWILAGHIICRGRPFNSFAVHRVANSIDPDQTEHTLFAKNISKMFQQKTKQTRFIVINVFFGLRDFVYFQNVMLFSEKCADPHEKSYYACGNSSRPSLFAKNPLLGETELL